MSVVTESLRLLILVVLVAISVVFWLMLVVLAAMSVVFCDTFSLVANN
ncbi:Uncharacterised protein [Salmonella enterica subsp. enterica serovar Bovismorbificans]|nr:Uncharacterised protein [Salmonella enterica subsp. enterica serovar Bovismorbificans]